jgi:hypothetical protein
VSLCGGEERWMQSYDLSLWVSVLLSVRGELVEQPPLQTERASGHPKVEDGEGT